MPSAGRSLPNWARWLLVLPAALLSYVVVQLIVAVLFSLSQLQSLSPALSEKASQMVNSTVGPYCFVFIGAFVAPSRKLLSAIVLTVLGVAILTGITVSAMMLGADRFGFSGWTIIASSLVGLISCAVACMRVAKEEAPPP